MLSSISRASTSQNGLLMAVRSHGLGSASSLSQLFKRGYAASSGKPTGSGIRNPNDPNYVPPAADSRTELIKKIVFPASVEGKASTTTCASDLLPFPPSVAEEVHSTIVRAWLLFQRQQREKINQTLNCKHERMRQALRDLLEQDERLYNAAIYRVNPNKRHPEEYAKLTQMGLITAPGQPANPDAPTGAQARRLIKAVAGGARLSGLFPREMRIPTSTPSRNGWPSYQPPSY